MHYAIGQFRSNKFPTRVFGTAAAQINLESAQLLLSLTYSGHYNQRGRGVFAIPIQHNHDTNTIYGSGQAIGIIISVTISMSDMSRLVGSYVCEEYGDNGDIILAECEYDLAKTWLSHVMSYAI